MTVADQVRAAQSLAAARATVDLAAELAHARDLGAMRAERLVAVAVQGSSIHHGRVSRVLHSWYVECYEAGIDRGLGRRDVVDPGPAAVELRASFIAANIGAIEGERPGWPFYMAAAVYRRGLHDGAVAAESVWLRLQERAVEWSQRVAPAERSDVSAQIVQQWYRRCYLAAVNEGLGLSTDLRQVTAAEVEAVLRSVEAGETVRLVHPDGVPVMTKHNTRTSQADRRIDAGEIGVIFPPPPQADSTVLEQQVDRRWDAARPSVRASLAREAGLPTALAEVVGRIGNLSSLDASTQTSIRRAYLHRLAAAAPEPAPYSVRDEDRISGPPDQAAAEMFGLDPSEATTRRARREQRETDQQPRIGPASGLER